MKKLPKWICVILAGLLFLWGCKLEKESGLQRTRGSEVTFGASTSYLNGPSTRTAYSGAFAVDGGAQYERIDWVPGKDQFRVVCAAAEYGPKQDNTAADYRVTGTPTASGRVSQAGVENVEPNGLRWGDGTHNFFAFYPAPGMTSEYNRTVSSSDASIVVDGSDKATVTGIVKGVQEYAKYKEETKSGVLYREYKPDMNYAYMYAATVAESGPGNYGSVGLSFKPLVTTFELTFKAADATAQTFKLKSVAIESESGANGSDLAGKFSASLKKDGTYTPSFTSTSRSVKVTIPAADQKVLSPTDVIKVTLFALPTDQKHLTLVLTFDKGGTEQVRRLALKADKNNDHAVGTDEWITVAGGKKVYLTNVGVPGDVWHYHITTTAPSDMIAEGGTSKTGKVVSYRENGFGRQEAVAWTVVGYYSDANCTSRLSSRPAWLTSVTESGSGKADASAETVTIDYAMSALTNTVTETEADVNARIKANGIKGSPTQYMNLANPSDMTSDYIKESANCYIVNAAGYYRIPLVMGNGIVNNAVNPVAASYKGSSGTNQIKFVTYIGAQVQTPYLHKLAGIQPGDTYASHNPFGGNVPAHVVWEDVNGLIECTGNYDVVSTTYSTGSGDSKVYWLTFHVAKQQQGNAVIAVRSLAGDVMWSWHIWVTDYIPANYPNSSSSRVKDTQVKSFGQDHTYDLMPENLGWFDFSRTWKTYAERTVYAKVQQTGGETAVMKITQKGLETRESMGRNPMYQWGRKDALWPTEGTVRHTDYTPWAIQPTWWGRSPTLQVEEGGTALVWSIRFPNVFYPRRGRWNNELQADGGYAYNFWNANKSNTAIEYVTGVKTIYDPCPAGYCIPVTGTFTGFTSDSYNHYDEIHVHDADVIYTGGPDFGKGIITFRKFGDFNKGWHMYTNSSKTATLFFPCTGYRDWVSGVCVLTGEDDCYWASESDGEGNALNFRINSTYDGPRHSHLKAYGCSVRPVRVQ